jgi:2,3-bisphosphoglycerate-dependent phosphoglycerate mutase
VVAVSIQLWLVRHGSTDWSDAGRFLGWKDVPLNRAGRLQARRLGEDLADVNLTSRWSSDLLRATETAHLAALDAAADPRLRELNFGHLEGRTWNECGADVQEALLRFDGFRAPEGESVLALRARVLAFVDSLPDGDHVLFTHGGVIRVLLREAYRDRRVAPGEVVRLRW